MQDDIYSFGNGVRVYRRHVLDHQVDRYVKAQAGNLHEPVEEHWFLTLLGEIPAADPLVYDIGCGIGYYTLLLLHERPGAEAVAFEPLPDHAAAIRENLALNGIAPDRLRLIEAAAHVAEGDVCFEAADFSSRVADEGGLRVAARDIAALLAAEARPVDLAKLDVQGAELALLRRIVEAGQADRVRRWIVGTHGDDLFAECCALLGQHWRVVHSDPAPAHQPDGLIVAVRD
ncbi:hypothetical protein BV509_02580 [Rhodovulum sulfidophilum]|uniref:FkbM family methyltransferase n=1 Tax=Rhodovulum visakhapatnamense TaxID=364297 RepID=A0ABS1RDF8_9RHOB|nr:FkbM family methyltransferase [Rhodovulum visakhapatnamense]MBL3570686.1 FkbM family methyltransferase [Rhodovulum visakhapatnamense]MBL3577674.1 FkbM family methyltransferase [Rhodovulum visakhapatnamense]OLS43326.1 hypothetical protein BV509_02580 [Rhodovulum sulfidophilum]